MISHFLFLFVLASLARALCVVLRYDGPVFFETAAMPVGLFFNLEEFLCIWDFTCNFSSSFSFSLKDGRVWSKALWEFSVLLIFFVCGQN